MAKFACYTMTVMTEAYTGCGYYFAYSCMKSREK